MKPISHNSQVRVNHQQQDFKEGETYIMTLKDCEVVGGSSSDEDDKIAEIENVQLQSAFKQKIIQKRKNAMLGHTINKYLPDLDDDDWKNTDKLILSKYDDIEQVAEKSKQKFTISLNDNETQLSN